MAWKRLTAFAASIVMAGSLTGCAGRETAKALCDAIMAGDRNGIESLMDAMDDFDRPNVALPALVEALEGDASTPLLTALRIGDAETALALLEAGASATYAPGKLAYPLEAYCGNGGSDTETIAALLERGADPNQWRYVAPVDGLNRTLARTKGDALRKKEDAIVALLDAGAAPSFGGTTVLHGAAWCGDAEYAKRLLEIDGIRDLASMENHESLTPREAAEKNGNEECAAVLREAERGLD